MSVLDATVSGASANSYVTVAVAQAYFDNRLNIQAWDAADEDAQENALQMACREIDLLTFTGYVTSYSQALQWPRVGVADRNGQPILSTTIPTLVQNAQCERALEILQAGDTAGGDLSAFAQVTLGSMSVTPKSSQPAISKTVKSMLAPFLAAGFGIPVFRA
jgi:hypothetical protein